MITQLLTATALLSAPAASPPRCMTAAEAGDVGVVLSAEMVSGLARMCGPALSTTAFLRSDAGTTYMQHLREGASAGRTRAVAALDRVLASRIPAGITAEAILSGMSQIPTPAPAAAPSIAAVCPPMDRLIQAMSPLPNENVAMAVTAMVDMAIAISPFIKEEQARQRAAGRPVPDEMPDISSYFCAR